MRTFRNVLLFARKPHGRKVTKLFGKPKLDLHGFQQFFTPPNPAPETGARVKPPSVQVFPKHTHHILNNSFM